MRHIEKSYDRNPRTSGLFIIVFSLFIGGYLYGQNINLIGSIETSGEAKAVFVYDTLAFIADGRAGMEIYKVSNPANPEFIGAIATTDPTEAIYVRGNYAYIADNHSGLLIVDFTDPGQPNIAGTFDTPCQSVSVTIDSNRAFIADIYGGLVSVDISNPVAPIGGGRYGDGQVFDLAIKSGYAYLAAGGLGLQVVDICDPRNFILISNLYNPVGAAAKAISISGDYAYLAGSNGCLQVIDIENPSNPLAIANLTLPARINDLYVIHNYAYLALSDSTIAIVDIVAPNNPVIILTYETPFPVNGIFVINNFIYAAAGADGLKILQFLPNTPRINRAIKYSAIQTPNDPDNNQHNATRLDYNSDVAVNSIVCPVRHYPSGYTVPLIIVVANPGLSMQSFDCAIEVVKLDSSGFRYNDIVSITALAPAEIDTVNFGDSLLNLNLGFYKVTAYSMLNGDEDNSNDTCVSYFMVSPNYEMLGFWFGNLDQSPILTYPGRTVPVDVYMINGDIWGGCGQIYMLDLCLGANNNFVDSFVSLSGPQVYYPLSLWDSSSFSQTYGSPPNNPGFVSQDYFSYMVSGYTGIICTSATKILTFGVHIKSDIPAINDTVDVFGFGYTPYTGQSGGFSPCCGSLLPMYSYFSPLAIGSPADTGTISGLVSDSLFGPISGAIVSALTTDKKDTTDINGAFFIGGLYPDNYNIQFSHPSHYDTIVGIVNVAIGHNTNFDVRMIPHSVADAGVSNIINIPESTFFGSNYAVRCEITNFGYENLATSVLLNIHQRGSLWPVLSESLYLSNLAAYGKDTVEFPIPFSPSDDTTYIITACTVLPNDTRNVNDTCHISTKSYSFEYLGACTMPGYSDYNGSLVVSGNYAYAASTYDGLSIINVADPYSPVQISFFPSRVHTLALLDTIVIAATYGHLLLINVANPANPTIINDLTAASYMAQLAIRGNYFYVACEYSGVRIYNCSNRQYPSLVNTFSTSGSINSIYLEDKLLAIGDRINGLYILDISDPVNPIVVGNLFSLGTDHISSIYMDERYVYVGTELGGLYVVQHNQGASPTIVGHCDLSTMIKGIEVSGEFLYCIDHEGFRVVDISSASNPVIACRKEGPGYGGAGIQVKNREIYLSKINFNIFHNLRNTSIQGIISYINSDPASNAIINPIGSSLRAITDNNGNYFMYGVKSGSRDFLISASNCPSFYLNSLAIPADTVFNLDIQLPCLGECANYILGNINGDSEISAADVTYGVRYFKGLGISPLDSCYMDSTGTYLYVAGDCNGNCEFRGSDVTRLVAYFKGSAQLAYCHFFLPQPLKAQPTTLPDMGR